MSEIERRSQDDVYDSLKTRIIDNTTEDIRPTNWNVGSVIRTFTEEVSEDIAELEGKIFEALKQAFMSTAEGIYLDRKLAEFDKERLESVFTEGNPIFYRDEAADTNIPIPYDTAVCTQADAAGRYYGYTVTETDAVLAAGETEVTVAIKATVAGSAFNVGEGTISQIVNPIEGVDGVRNEADWITTEGRDTELDDAARRRGSLAWEELARGTRDAAYLLTALTAGATDAFVRSNEPRGPGTVDIYILGPDGMPTDELVATVQTAIDAFRPSETSSTDILVRKPRDRPVDINLTVTPFTGYETTALDASIRLRMDAYFTPQGSTSFPTLPKIGVGIEVLLFNMMIICRIGGVYNAVINSPTSDITVEEDELSTLNSLTITFEEPKKA